MGLAGPRKRRKIAEDPQNTAWTRSQGFGHSMLLSQGWKPGQGLGRENTEYGGQQLASGFKPIKAVFREENVGLGADKGGDQKFGLDMLQSVLGRLNGRSEQELEKQAQARQKANAMVYAEVRLGKLRFVRGETLCGSEATVGQGMAQGEGAGKEGDKNVERRATVGEQDGGEALQLKEKGKKRKDKKESKSKKAERSESAVTESESFENEEGVGVTDRKKDKAEKRARKEARREARRRRKEAEGAAAGGDSAGQDDAAAQRSETEVEEPAKLAPADSVPVLKQTPPSARHFVRQRYIQQKRMAMMDPKALNEILMVRT